MGLRHHHRWSLPCRQAPGRAEEQEMEAQLRVDLHSSHASVQEEGRVVPVLGGHSGCLRAVSFACCQSQQIAILPAQVSSSLDYHLTTPLKGSRCIHLSLMGIPGHRVYWCSCLARVKK